MGPMPRRKSDKDYSGAIQTGKVPFRTFPIILGFGRTREAGLNEDRDVGAPLVGALLRARGC